MKHKDDISLDLFLQIFLVGRQIRKKIKRQSKDRMLNGSILLVVSRQPQTISSLAKLLSISLSTASEKVNQLKRNNLLQFNVGEDKRISLISLTSKGKLVLNQIEEHIKNHAQLAFKNISLDEQHSFLITLTKISSNLERI